MFDDDPGYQRLKAIRDTGYTGWVDQDYQRRTDAEVTAMCHQAADSDTGEA